jgi:hypothetical protein
MNSPKQSNASFWLALFGQTVIGGSSAGFSCGPAWPVVSVRRVSSAVPSTWVRGPETRNDRGLLRNATFAVGAEPVASKNVNDDGSVVLGDPFVSGPW